MKKSLVAGLVGLSLSFGVLAAAPALAQAPAAAFTVDATPIETMVADPAAKAILDKDVPGMTAHPAYDQFKAMTLKQLQPLSQGVITDAILVQVAADLAAMPK